MTSNIQKFQHHVIRQNQKLKFLSNYFHPEIQNLSMTTANYAHRCLFLTFCLKPNVINKLIIFVIGIEEVGIKYFGSEYLLQ